MRPGNIWLSRRVDDSAGLLAKNRSSCRQNLMLFCLQFCQVRLVLWSFQQLLLNICNFLCQYFILLLHLLTQFDGLDLLNHILAVRTLMEPGVWWQMLESSQLRSWTSHS